MAFVLASFIMGAAGALQSLNTAYVEPSGSFSLQWTIDIVTVVIIGGMATRVGPWIGAVFTVVLVQVLASYPDIHDAITGVILILVIRFAPRGIWGTAVTTSARIRARVHAVSNPPGSPPRRGALLDVAGVTKRFGAVAAIDGVDLSVPFGEFHGVIGPNGPARRRYRTDQRGSPSRRGADRSRRPRHHRARCGQPGPAGHRPHPPGAPDLPAADGAGKPAPGPAQRSPRAEPDRAMATSRENLARTGLADAAGRQTRDLPLLSRKRLELARALALEPRILLLDEIRAGLSQPEVEELITLVASLRSQVDGILLVEHVLDVVTAACDNVTVLELGRVLVRALPRRFCPMPRWRPRTWVRPRPQASPRPRGRRGFPSQAAAKSPSREQSGRLCSSWTG